MIDLALLRVIKYREQFQKVHRYIPKSGIDKRTRAVAKDFGRYFEAHEDAEEIDFPAFRSLFFTSWHRNLKDADCEYYNKLITRIEEDVPESVKKSIINQLLVLEFATDLGNVLHEYEVGEEVDIVTEVDKMLKHVKDSVERSTNFEFADIDDTTIGTANNEDGYHWPLQIMNDHYRPAQGGDQYIVCGRPGIGKTSFLTFLNQGFAQYMSENKIIVWFNNESRRQRIMSRQIQSALKMTNKELSELKATGKLNEEYIKVMGRKDRVRVYDVHGKTNHQIEEVLEGIGIDNVGLIIFDMLDNVKFPTWRDVREDQRLEQLYQWARELGVKYNCPTIPTSQVSNEGAGLLFPTENMLKESKTGKQGACDGIIMVGKSDDPMLARTRGLSMPKTKTKREGMPDMREEILFDEDRGVFI